MHVVYDADAGCPIYAVVTAQRINDITAAKDMPIEAGSTYVFDLGSYDYGIHVALPHGVLLERLWAKLDEAGCRIVTQLKSNTPLTVIEERAAVGGVILSDRVGYLPERQAQEAEKSLSRSSTGGAR